MCMHSCVYVLLSMCAPTSNHNIFLPLLPPTCHMHVYRGAGSSSSKRPRYATVYCADLAYDEKDVVSGDEGEPEEEEDACACPFLGRFVEVFENVRTRFSLRSAPLVFFLTDCAWQLHANVCSALLCSACRTCEPTIRSSSRSLRGVRSINTISRVLVTL
jgi:hypothetical protein